MIWASLIMLGLYIGYVTGKYGIPESLSQTYYRTGWIFQGVMFAGTFLIIPEALENDSLWAFLGLIGMLLVGVTPNMKNPSIERATHIAGVVLSFIGCIAWTIELELWWSFIGFIWLLGILWKKECWTFWLELGCYTVLYLNLICNEVSKAI